MLMAKNAKQQWVIATELAKNSKKENYYCPDCMGRVQLKIGKSKINHFAHIKKCSNNSFSEGETEEHLKGKYFLYRLLTQQGYFVKIEPYLKLIKQRPDLLCYNARGEKIAIEFQCSPISSQKLKERTEGYKKINCPVIWIVGRKNSQLKQYKFAYFRHQLMTYYLDVAKEKCCILYQRKKYFSHYFFDFGFTDEYQLHFQNSIINQYNWYANISKRFLKILYQLQISLTDIPKIIFLQQQFYPGLKSKMNEFLCLLYIVILKQPCTFDECFSKMIIYIQYRFIQLHNMPLVNKKKFIKALIKQGLNILIDAKLIYLKNKKYELKKKS